jgi:hypothetical protein
MKMHLRALGMAFVLLFLGNALVAQYTMQYASSDLQHIENFTKTPTGYYALRAYGKMQCFTMDNDLKLLKTAQADKAPMELHPFRLGENMYLLTVKCDSKKGTFDFYYSTYAEPTRFTVLKSYNLKQYGGGSFAADFFRQYEKSNLMNILSPSGFKRYYGLSVSPDYKNLVFYWINPDSVLSPVYELTVFNPEFKVVGEHKIKAKGGFTDYVSVRMDIHDNVFFTSSNGEGGRDFLRFNLKNAETVSKSWQTERLQPDNYHYDTGDSYLDTETGELTVTSFFPFRQDNGSTPGTKGVNKTADMGIVSVYDRNGDLIKKNGIRFTEADMAAMKAPGEGGTTVNTKTVYPVDIHVHRFSNGNYAVAIETRYYMLKPPTSSSDLSNQVSMGTEASHYYSPSENNYVVRVYNKQHEQIKEYNLYRRRLRPGTYVGKPYSYNDQFWLFYVPAEEVYPEASAKGMVFAYVINNDGELSEVKVETDKGAEVCGFAGSALNPLPGIPMQVTSRDEQMGFLRKK